MEKLLYYELSRKLFERVDKEKAEETCAGGCQVPDCNGVLHRSDYERKPRGFGAKNETVKRVSYCCNQEDCRKRHTPPSLRFFGRKFYDGIIIVLLTAMTHGVNARRAAELRRKLGIEKKTLNRWRKWWLENFNQSAFWREVKGNFPNGIDQKIMPLSLADAFEVTSKKTGLLKLMEFLSPISIGPLETVAGGK